MAEQKIETPNQSELEWVQGNLKVASALVAAYTGKTDETAAPGLRDLDEVYARWYEDWVAPAPEHREDPNPYINAVGIAFGQRLVDDLGLRWAVVTDEHGTEIAVHGEPGDILVFPPNLVAKRFERGEIGFLGSVYEEIAQQVREVRGA
jgi:hypothetical protein